MKNSLELLKKIQTAIENNPIVTNKPFEVELVDRIICRYLSTTLNNLSGKETMSDHQYLFSPIKKGDREKFKALCHMKTQALIHDIKKTMDELENQYYEETPQGGKRLIGNPDDYVIEPTLGIGIYDIDIET